MLALTAACGRDPTGPRRSAHPLALADSVFGDSVVQWFTADTAGAWTMRPELDGPRVYFERSVGLSDTGTVTSPAELVALDRETGALLWHSQIISAHSAAVAGDVVAAAWGSLQTFDRATGTPARHLSYGPTSLSSNVVSDGARFYVASHDGHVLAVNPTTGTAEWDTDLARGSSTTAFGVALSGDAVAVGLKHFRPTGADPDSGIVAIVDRATGALRWRVTLPGSLTNPGIVRPPVITDDLVIVVTQGHAVRAFDVRTGALRWWADESSGTPELASDGLAACDGLVIVPTGELGLVALEAATGSVRWRLGNLGEGSLHRVECSHGTVLTLGGGLRVFDARTGAARATYPVLRPGAPHFWIASATRDDEWLYVGTTYGFAKVRAP